MYPSRSFIAAATLFLYLFIVSPLSSFRGFSAQPVNDPPVAVNDSYTLHGNGTIGSLLTNDSDPNNDSMTVVLVTYPTYGSLSGLGAGYYSYGRSSASWTGTDSFTYKACDWGLCSSPATVTITVVNQAPTAVNDSYSIHGSTIIGPMKANDYDPDGDGLSFSIITSPTNGTIYGLSSPPYSNDQKSYGANYGYTGSDSFTYKVCDPFNACSTATVSLNVWNNPPAANADFYIVNAGTSATIGPLRGNDSDPDGDTFGIPSMTVAPANGTIYGLSDPDYKLYGPNAGFTGTDTWQYRITDSLGRSSTATVYILVLASAPPPKVPYAECPSDPGCLSNFNPQSGGSASTTGGPAGRAGPS